MEDSLYLVEHIPEAKYVELQDDAHFYFIGDSDAFVYESQEFLAGQRSQFAARLPFATKWAD